MLNHATQGLIALHAGLPDGFEVRVHSSLDNQLKEPAFLLRPQILTLKTSYCQEIEQHGISKQCDFLDGFAIESNGRVVARHPSYGQQVNLPEGFVFYWKTYQLDEEAPADLELTIEKLFVTYSDLDKLIRLFQNPNDLPKENTEKDEPECVAKGTMPPHLIVNPNDPEPDQVWYTPARYFARQLILQDSTLRVKLPVLTKKVAKMLEEAEIYAHDNHLKKSPLQPQTVKKAFHNIQF